MLNQSRRRQQNRFFESSGWMILVVIGFAVLIGLAPNPAYRMANYEYLISSVLQAMAAIFALTATVTILIFQIATEHSPQSLIFYPRRRFSGLLWGFLLLMAADGVLLTVLPEGTIYPWFQKLIDLVLLYNAAAVVSVIGHVGRVMLLLLPGEILKELVKQAEKADTNEERLYVVQSLEELAVSVISRHRISAVRPVIEAYADITDIFTLRLPELNAGVMEMMHPVREIPRSYWRVAINLLNSDMDNLMFYTAGSIAGIARASNLCDEREFLGNQISSIIVRIVDKCVQERKIEPAINFVRFMPVPEDQFTAAVIGRGLQGVIHLALDRSQDRLIQAALSSLSALTARFPGQAEPCCREAIANIKLHPDMLHAVESETGKTMLEQLEELEKALHLTE